MSACNFSIPFSGTPDEVLGKARSFMQSQGGNFDGDTNNGNFNASVFGNTIAGSYTVKRANIKYCYRFKTIYDSLQYY
jgi:hypothetical protein